MSKTFIHFGFQKTGTTTLQKHVFPYMQPLIFSSRSEAHGSKPEAVGMTQRLNRVRYLDEERLKLPSKGAGYLDELKVAFDLERVKFQSIGAPILISDETLLGPHPDGLDALNQRIRHVVGPAGVILVLREALGFFRSLYRQNLLNMLNILHQPTEEYARKLKHIRLHDAHTYFDLQFKGKGLIDQYFSYNAVVESLDHWFGPENVLVLNFEHMRKDISSFTQALSDFLNVSLVKRYDADDIPAENVAGGRLQPLLRKLVESEKVSPTKSDQIQEWYDNYQLTDTQVQLLRDIEAKKCAAAFSRCLAF